MKAIKFCSVVLAIALVMLFAVSCGGDGISLTDGYTVVYNADSESDVRLKALLEERFGELGNAPQFVEDTTSPAEKEIVLGNAKNRAEVESIRTNFESRTSEHIAAYTVKMSGTSLLIVASSPEAEAAAVDELFSNAKGGALTVPKSYNKTVYFDANEYRKSGEAHPYEIVGSVTDIASVTLYGETEIVIEKGKTDYTVQISNLTPLPTADEIDVELYHPDMSYSVSYGERAMTLKVTSADENASREYKISFSGENEYEVSSEVVNKDGAKGVLTLTSDDGNQRTADFLYTVLAKNYDFLEISVAMPTRELASLTTTNDGKVWLMDDDGNYVIQIIKNMYVSKISGSVFTGTDKFATKVDFWQEIVSTGQIEVLSHSHTHAAWGQSDELTYNDNGSIKYPAGNVIKELHASAQILSNLLSQETSFICRPGGHADLTSDYFFNLVSTDSTFIGMRTSNGAPPLPGATDTKLNAPEHFKDEYGRLRIATILVKGTETAFNEDGTGFAREDGDKAKDCIAAGISAWENYVNLAMENGQWASIGFHAIYPDTETWASGYPVFDSQVIALMEYIKPYVESGELWLASFTEASKYYFEWSGAETTAKAYGNERVEVTLTDKEEDERFNMPLTVKVSVPADWTRAELESYGETTELTVRTAEDGSRFVYANILPGDGVSVIRPVK